jgi:hypothetical protein
MGRRMMVHYRQASQVKVKQIGKSVALYVDSQKGIHVLNDTARFIWEILEEPFTHDELLDMLSQVFDGDPATMKADLEDILDRFLRYRLIQADG